MIEQKDINTISKQILSLQKKAALTDIVPFLIDIIDLMPDFFIVLDKKMRIVYCNQKFCDVVGIDFKNIINQDVDKFLNWQGNLKSNEIIELQNKLIKLDVSIYDLNEAKLKIMYAKQK